MHAVSAYGGMGLAVDNVQASYLSMTTYAVAQAQAGYGSIGAMIKLKDREPDDEPGDEPGASRST